MNQRGRKRNNGVLNRPKPSNPLLVREVSFYAYFIMVRNFFQEHKIERRLT